MIGGLRLDGIDGFAFHVLKECWDILKGASLHLNLTLINLFMRSNGNEQNGLLTCLWIWHEHEEDSEIIIHSTGP